MLRQRSTLRPAALIAAAALALHELRYLVGHGDRSAQALADQGHGYLPVAGALAALLLALAGAELASAIARSLRGGSGERQSAPLGARWALASAALLSVYTGQELVEGLLASGHPTGVDAILADGGLVCVPLALGLGLLVALALRGADAAIAAVARRRITARTRCRTTGSPRLAAAPGVPSSSVLARKLAGRAPPAAC